MTAEKNLLQSPIIIIGMHRSGTSFLSGMLEAAGVWIGDDNGELNESKFFLGLNEDMLAQAGGSWEYPQPIKHLLNDQSLRVLKVDYLRKLMQSKAIKEFLGSRQYRKEKNLYAMSSPWGWKDPRNTYTLPIWLDLFPRAKIIHITRHGVDVANSLVARREQEIKRALSKVEKLKRYGFSKIPRDPLGAITMRCHTLESAFKLWKEYLEEANRQMENLAAGQGLSLRYEELLAEPQKMFGKLIKFLGLSVTQKQNDTALSHIRSSRRMAYQQHPELAHFAKSHEEQLAVFGYTV